MNFKLIIAAFWFSAFTGIFQLFGISSSILKVILISILFIPAIYLYFFSYISRKKSREDFINFLCFCLIPIVFSLLQTSFAARLSIFQALSPLLIFWCLTILFSGKYSYNLNFHVYLFIAVQFVVSLYKFLVYGQNEGILIGTVSLQAGSLSTYIATLIFLNMTKHQNKKIFLNLTFFLIGSSYAWINEKRFAIILGALFFSIALYQSRKRIAKQSRFIYFMILPILILITGLPLIYSIDTILDGGSLLNFGARVTHYLTQTDSSGTPIGRLAGLQDSLSIFDYNFYNLAIGLNPIQFFTSNLSSVATKNQLFFPSSFLIVFYRCGLVGLSLYAMMFRNLLKDLNKPCLFLLAYCMFDFIIYSDSILVNYFYVISLFLVRNQLRAPRKIRDSLNQWPVQL